MRLHPENDLFKEPSCTDVVKIQPPTPTAEFCASPMSNDIIFGILQLWILHGNQLFSLVPG